MRPFPGHVNTMKTAVLLAAAALALLVLAPSTEAAPASHAEAPAEAHITCLPLPQPIQTVWAIVCGTVRDICDLTDLCE